MASLRDPRAWCLAIALAALVAALTVPRLRLDRPVHDLLLVIDITGSMNAHDQLMDGQTVSRLEAAKAVARDLLAGLPCGSHLGLGLFTERRSFLLIEPAETCASFAALDGALAALDWRMAWEGDSRVASGLNGALALARGLSADLLFLTDGHEAPLLPASGPAAFEGEPGAVRGLIVGVGGAVPVPIPKFDDKGRESGFYAMGDIPQESRIGAPPLDASGREGWHPRHAPYGSGAGTGEEHLSRMRESHLRDLARRTGLGFAPLRDAAALQATIGDGASSRTVPVSVDIAVLPASLALISLILTLLIDPLRALRARAGRITPPSPTGSTTYGPAHADRRPPRRARRDAGGPRAWPYAAEGVPIHRDRCTAR